MCGVLASLILGLLIAYSSYDRLTPAEDKYPELRGMALSLTQNAESRIVRIRKNFFTTDDSKSPARASLFCMFKCLVLRVDRCSSVFHVYPN
jgi:hypothetical protein